MIFLVGLSSSSNANFNGSQKKYLAPDNRLVISFWRFKVDSVLICFNILKTSDVIYSRRAFVARYANNEIEIPGLDTINISFVNDRENIHSKIFGHLKFLIFIESSSTFPLCTFGSSKIESFLHVKNIYVRNEYKIRVDSESKSAIVSIDNCDAMQIKFYKKYPKNKQARSFFFIRNKELCYEGFDLWTKF